MSLDPEDASTLRATSASSFELLESGVVDSLLQFATDGNCTGVYNAVTLRLYSRPSKTQRKSVAARKIKNLNANQTPFATLVKKLQESLLLLLRQTAMVRDDLSA